MIREASPGAGVEPALTTAFTPVALRYRRDGWTPARQRIFLCALARSGCVTQACRRVGMSGESAYKLYRRLDAASFRRAWDEALGAFRVRHRPALPPPAMQGPPRRPPFAIPPVAALSAQAALLPASTENPRTSWQASTWSTSSTSAGAAERAR